LSNKIPAVETIELSLVSGICFIQSSDLTNTKIGIYESGFKSLDTNIQFSTNKINDSTNVLVISQTIVKDKPNTIINLFNKHFKTAEYNDKFVVHDEWIQKCIQAAKIIDLTPYLVNIVPVNSSVPTTTAANVATAAAPVENTTALSGSKRKKDDAPKSNDPGKFFCISSGTVVAPPPAYNENLVQQLELCKNASKNNPFQVRNYDKVIKLVKSKGIYSFPEFQEVYPTKTSSTIGKKVLEFFEYGFIGKAELVRTNPEDLAVTELKSVWGIGIKTATDLVRRKKITTIEELRRRVAKEPNFLTHSQLIGLKRHEEIIQKIPRDEVEQILAVVKIAAQKLEPNCEVVAGGSYRRGELICGDVDIIIGPARGKSFITIGPKLIDDLTESGFITDQLTNFGFGSKRSEDSKKKGYEDDEDDGHSTDADMAGDHDSSESSRYSMMGVCKLPAGIHRRIDIKTYPRRMFSYAILAFTGSAHFNRSMRYYSRHRKNMQLSDQGLWELKKDDSGKNKVKVSSYHPQDKRIKGNLIVCETEEDIFKALDLPYKAPNERSGFAVADDGMYIVLDPNEVLDDSNDEEDMYYLSD
jgi:DNA polymerase/3'-5' exonuclease PolX